MPQMNQFESEDPLAHALQRLARNSSQVPSAEVGARLEVAFRRHHRRRRIRNAAFVVLAICCLASAALLFTRASKVTPTVAKTSSSAGTAGLMSSTIGSTNPPANTRRLATEQDDVTGKAIRHHRSQSAAPMSVAFLSLPSYDPALAKDELQIIRVEMPIQDLRMVGAPIGADVPNRLVQADFAVGRDGTPYGVRLVR